MNIKLYKMHCAYCSGYWYTPAARNHNDINHVYGYCPFCKAANVFNKENVNIYRAELTIVN